MTSNRRTAIALTALAVLLAARCSSWGGGSSAPVAAGLVFSGTVTDQQGQPVSGARVEVGGKETRSGADGTFNLPVRPAEGYILNISHPDYADLSYRSRIPIPSQEWTLTRAQVATVDPTGPITLVDNRPELTTKHLGGATFTLPPDALVDDHGNPPSGMLRAAIATLDVANGEGPGDWAVRSDDGRQDGYLVSYGAVFVQFTDSAGKHYQLRSGKAAQLSLPVLPNMTAHAPANPSARFWYYDLKDGYWKSIGPASFNVSAGAYRGAVTHLSTINTDIAKFENAACLKITVDPSIPAGRKLRIRYHSGGTPFGQTPTFVMNDPVNAAWRLPANTNVLLELLDASNNVISNMVVEDPMGMATVNNVITTGPAIPMGHTLWPGPPYTDCHPILLRMGNPQVELRINELPADPAMQDNPSDDYITWAPTFCRARLTTPSMSDVNVVLTNDPPGAIAGGGDVKFAAYTSPWPAATTATLNTLPLTLPADGSWVEFVIAGKFGTPSTNDKDAIIEAHLNTAGGTIIGTKPLMVRVRKNANNLTASERSRFLFAMRAFRNQLGANYVRFQEMHRLASSGANDQGHMQPAFFPWHRAMLLDVERELQKIDPSVSLHYWNWDAAAPNVFTQDFMGEYSGPPDYIAEPDFSATNPLNGWNTDLPFASGEIRRNTDDHTLAPTAGYFKPLDSPGNPSMIDQLNYGPRVLFANGSFSDEEEELGHNPAHGWPCAGGHLRFPVRSAADPLFYLLHSQVDRQWAYWQWKRNRYGASAPADYDNTGHFDDPGVSAWYKGSFLEDGMWPWDGTSGGGPGRAQRPLNQAAAPDTNVPLSMPLIPSTPFPASPQKNLWPAVGSIPTPHTMIDYFGRAVPANGLGFCYDDVPY